MATKIFKVGDKESWNSTQCEVLGTVRKKLNVLTEISTRHAAASPQNPQLLVESASRGQADAQTRRSADADPVEADENDEVHNQGKK